ncbi:MAG: dUTP diphosphatase [Chloroflexota bacterium]
MRVVVTRIDPSIPLPRYASTGATAFDFFSRTDVTVGPGELGMVPTNVIVHVPRGHVLLVALRSSTPRTKGLLSPHGIGIIDQDFYGPTDEVMVQVYNFSPEEVAVFRGERIAQGLLVPLTTCEWEEGPPSGEASRGGFGSTG